MKLSSLKNISFKKMISYLFLGLFLIAFIYSHTLLGNTYSWQWEGKFTSENTPEIFFIESEDRIISGADNGNYGKPPLLLIHGSPGNWTGYEEYFKDPILDKNFHIISVDRPGYGMSGFGKPERSLKRQADIVAHVFERFDTSQKITIVGHSYGGPLAARISMDKPEDIASLIILAGSVAPELEPKTMLIQHIATLPLLELLVPSIGFSSNEEIIALRKGLEDMLPLWKNIDSEVTIIHGEDDSLVPVGNVDFMEEKLINAKSISSIRIPGGSHFIPWEYYEIVREAILQSLKK